MKIKPTCELSLLCAAVIVLTVFGAEAGLIFTSLYSFGSIQDTNGNALDGASPAGALIQGSDGNFYGTTEYGGTNGAGTVFKISTNGVFTSLYSFGEFEGDNFLPQAGLVQGSNGYLYGTTSEGGVSWQGTVFRISTNGVFTSLYSFTGGNDGGFPNALVQGSDGNFYGTTEYGGPNSSFSWCFGDGTVFKISANGVLTTIYTFGSITNADGNPLDGANPQAGLVQGSDGNFYGTTSNGGTNNTGTVFKISTNGVLTGLYSFYPFVRSISGLVQGSDGNLYGTSGVYHNNLGLFSSGTVFKISTNGAFTSLFSCVNPQGGLVQGSDGNFYGTTECNGFVSGCMDCFGFVGAGTVFTICTNGTFTKLYSFGSITNASGVALDGANPAAALVQGSDGSFYGTTQNGGTYGIGTVFRLTIVPEPQLSIIPYGENVILTWPTNAFVFTLQSSTDIGSAANWNTNSLAPIVIGGQNVIINPISNTQMFFRLQLVQ